MKKQWKCQVVVATEFVPSEERRKLYDTYWAEVQARQRASIDNFDKSILAYSSSGLAISLAFLKDFAPNGSSIWPGFLYFSWVLFVIATSLTIISFLASYKSQEHSLDLAHRYFIKGGEAARTEKGPYETFLVWSNRIAGMAFIVALILTAAFVILNLEKGSTMTDKNHHAQDGAPPASMQQTLHKGLPAASMPLAPAAPKPVAPVPQPTTTSNSQSGATKS